jgi:hypothetical protein
MPATHYIADHVTGKVVIVPATGALDPRIARGIEAQKESAAGGKSGK